jgi:hypothetical protein
MRAVQRVLKLEPKCKKLATDALPPTLVALPLRLTPLPTRAKLRNDIELPNFITSNTLAFKPHLANCLIEKLLPNFIAS